MSNSYPWDKVVCPPKLGSALLEGTVILKIGPDRLKYNIHKALLVYHSEYFRKALEGPWKEAEEGTFNLEDVEPDGVNIFVHWLYTRQLDPPYHPSNARYFAFKSYEDTLEAKIHAYAFADRFLIPVFRRQINADIIKQKDSGFRLAVSEMLSVATKLCKYIPSDRPMVQYFVDEHCLQWSNCCEDSAEDLANFPHSFTTRAMRRLSEMINEANCDYPLHFRCYVEHADEPEAAACKGAHMKYDKEKDFGFFHDTILCKVCEWDENDRMTIPDPELSADTGSSSSSEEE